MRFLGQVASTIIIQGFGAVAALLTVALLGYFMGPAIQGTFSQVKAEVEFVGAVAMIGLPQALFFLVHLDRMSIRRAKKFSLAAAAIGGVISIGVVIRSSSSSLGGALTFFGAAAALTWHGCLRGVVLSATDTRSFNIVTAMPQGLLLLYAAVGCLLGVVTKAQVGLAYTIAFASAGWLGVHWLRHRAVDSHHAHAVEEPLGGVLRYGLASGISGIGASLTVFLAIHAARNRFGAEAVGVFALALTLSQGVLVPLNYTVPLLFKRWIEMPTLRAPIVVALTASCSVALVSIAVREVTHHVPHIAQWAGRYALTTELLWILLIATAADASQRIVAVAANARGLPWLPAASEVMRVVVFASCLATVYPAGLSGLAWLVCIASLVACVSLFVPYLVSVRRAV